MPPSKENPAIVRIIAVLLAGLALVGLALKDAYVLDGTDLRPAPGYAWAKGSPIPYAVTWVPGEPHPERPHVMAAPERRNWIPQAGYQWVRGASAESRPTDSPADQWSVRWTPGLAHRDAPHIESDVVVGKWVAQDGYRFIEPGSDNLAVRWVPRAFRTGDRRYVAGEVEGSWDPAPGYMLLAGGTEAEAVRWAPGRVHSFEPCLRAGKHEGSWQAVSGEYEFVRLSGGGMQIRARRHDVDWGGVVLGGIVAAAGYVFGGGDTAKSDDAIGGLTGKGVDMAVDAIGGNKALECDGRAITNKAIFGPYA